MPLKVKEILSDVLTLIGAALLSVGAGLIFLPAGLICGGVCIGLIGYAIGSNGGDSG